MSITTPPIGNKNVSNSMDSEINTEKIQSGQESKLPADTNQEAPDTSSKSTNLSKSGAQAKMAEQSLTSFARQQQIVSAPQVAAIPTSTSSIGKTVDDQFRDAALKNDTKKMEELLKKGANVNSTDANGKTALMLAATSGNRAAMETLVKRYHADVTVKDSNGETALSQAASLGLNDSVQTLLQFPKVINEVDTNGNTALMNAIKHGHSNVATTLLQKGADASIADNHGRTPLMEAVQKGDGRSVKELLKHNPGFDMQDENGKTALMEAIEKGNPAVIRALAKHSDPDLQDKNGNTALMLALRKGLPGTPADPTAINDMIGRSRNLELQNKDGRTALMEASKSEDGASVKALVDKGVDVNIQDKNGKTAIMDLFDGPHVLAPADFGLAKDAMIGKADLDLKDKNGRTVLIQVSNSNDTESMKTLKDAGADVNIQDKDGKTALMNAAENGNLEAVRSLLDKADPALIDNNHNSAWRLAYNHLKNVPMDDISKQDFEKILDLLPAERYKPATGW
jgi:ankyrin repeat protein